MLRRKKGEMCGSKTRDRHPEGRTGDVIEARSTAEGDRFGVAAMLAADRNRHVGARALAPRGTDQQQLPHPLDVEDVERILGKDPLVDIGRHEAPGIVARQAIGHLRQVIGAEGQEMRVLGDLARPQRGPRRLHHHAEAIGELGLHLGAHGGRHRVDPGLDDLDLARGRDQRDHHLGHHLGAAPAGLDRRLEDRAGLHVVDLGHGHAKAHAAHAEHRVEFRKRLAAPRDLAQRPVERLSQLAHPLAVVRQELMQRRVEEPDADRLARHDVEERDEVGALHRQQTLERDAPVVRRVGKDHLPHQRQAILVEEHVLGAGKADALGLEHARGAGILGSVGIRPHADVAHVVGPVQQRAEAVVERRLQHLGDACQHLAIGAVNGNHVAFAEDPAAGRAHHPFAGVDRDIGAARDAGQPEAARDHRGMAGHAAALGQHGDGSVHATDVLGRGLAPHQDAGLVARGRGLGGGSGEDDAAGGGAGACRDAAGKAVARAARVDLIVQELRQRPRLDPQERLLAADDAVLGERHGDLHRRPRRAHHPHRVDHRDPPALDREFDLHLLAQFRPAGEAIALQLGEDLGRGLLERGAARIAGEVERLDRGLAALALPAKAAGDAACAGHPVGELHRARTGQPRPDAKRHALHQKAEHRLERGALRLAQKPCRRPLPGPRHRAQHLAELAGGRLRELLVGLGAIGGQRRGQRPGARLVMEHVGIEPRDMGRVILHEAQIERIGRLMPVAVGQPRVHGIVHADVQHCPRPAPFGIFRARAHRNKEIRPEHRSQPLGVGQLPGDDRAHRLAGQRHGLRHRQIKPDQPLQALRPPAMARDTDLRRGRQFDKFSEIRVFLHCSNPPVPRRICGNAPRASATIR
ncbi:hypothetical protein SDC9_40953 [bioreactor metagenome]|uniref:Uncharacterized protein n=1 Tax=bioreactor metagenome TaxID=1076179 RepID=A0A644VTP5_9ZZZZ